jgi:hypothetical protein
MVTMKRCKSVIALAAIFAASSGFAATMTHTDYSNAKDRIGADYKADNMACDAETSNAKDVCKAHAESKENVALAELEFSYTGKASDRHHVMVVRADSAYLVAKNMCGDSTGNPKDICLTEASATHTKAIADAKRTNRISDANHDAAQDKRDADYSVAKQKCDALAGDAQTSCINAAKTRFSKA